MQHTARLGETLSTILIPHEMHDRADAHGFSTPPRGEVSFQDVVFHYPTGPNVLEHFNLHVTPGTRVGLVGRSGSGKSTVLALLQRQRYVQDGAVMIDPRVVHIPACACRPCAAAGCLPFSAGFLSCGQRWL